MSNRIAARVVWVVAPWRSISPNAITAMNGGLGLGIAYLLGSAHERPTSGWLLAGLVELYVVLDCVDGQLARYTRRTSSFGASLDSLVDRIVHPALFFGAAVWASGNDEASSRGLPYFGLAAVLSTSFTLLYPHNASAAPRIEPTAPAIGSGTLRRLYEVFRAAVEGMQVFLLLSLTCIIERPDLFLWVASPVLFSLALLRNLVAPLIRTLRAGS